MPRIDDYINAKKLALEELSRIPFEVILKRSGFESPSENTFQVPFLDRMYLASYPQFEFSDQTEYEKEIPMQEQVLILHYLKAPVMPPPTNHWIAYREIPGAAFYFGAFVKRAVEPLKKVFGDDLAGFTRTAQKLKPQEIENGDAGFEFRVLPAVPLQLILWAADDEFPAEANILFDKNIGQILSPEDVAWLAGMVVYRLMALAR
ncbi:hypothetical protein D1BOALGB6SA_10395 [Olavius sp. associated proteobacterium Delta 1]|nr:hypothetical protein D1BOALGB6SA_10395 [Olavius sp. associated proteobacterium Delta 1]